MAQFASSAFPGSDGTELSASDGAWSKNSAFSSNDGVLYSGRVRNGNGTGNPVLYLHSGSPASADYSVSTDIYVASTAGSPASGVVGRSSTSVETNYHARFKTASGWQLYKFVSGGATQLGSTVAQTLSASNSYNIKLEMIGSAIKLFKEGSGTATISATDTAITTAGKSGIKLYDAAAPGDTKFLHLDNFSADDVVAGITLVGANSDQANASSSAAITQDHVLAGANSAQANSSATGGITQDHALAGASSAQANAGGTGAITQDGAFIGAPSDQVNASSEGAVTQAHVLSGSASSQENASGTGAVTLGAVHNLTASASTQANSGSSAAITQAHALVHAESVQDNVASASAIVQAHILSAANGSQANAGSTGAIVLGDVTLVSTVERTAIFRATVARGAKFQRSKSVSVKFN